LIDYVSTVGSHTAKINHLSSRVQQNKIGVTGRHTKKQLFTESCIQMLNRREMTICQIMNTKAKLKLAGLSTRCYSPSLLHLW